MRSTERKIFNYIVHQVSKLATFEQNVLEMHECDLKLLTRALTKNTYESTLGQAALANKCERSIAYITQRHEVAFLPDPLSSSDKPWIEMF